LGVLRRQHPDKTLWAAATRPAKPPLILPARGEGNDASCPSVLISLEIVSQVTAEVDKL
jgi:hypothetical protein